MCSLVIFSIVLSFSENDEHCLQQAQPRYNYQNCLETNYLDWFGIDVNYKIYTSDGETETKYFIVDKLETLQELTEMFGTWYYVYDDELISWSIALPELPQAGLADCFRRYKEHCGVNLTKMLSAYESEYNPIENYNGNETATESYTNYKDEKTISGKVKTNVDVENKNMTGEKIEDNTLSGYATSIHSESSFDSGDNVKVVSQDESKGAVVNSTNADSSSNYTEWDNYKEANQKYGSKTNTLTKHGNLGVTTNQKMINEELELRKHDIFENWLKEFANKHLILSYDDDDDDDERGCCYGY